MNSGSPIDAKCQEKMISTCPLKSQKDFLTKKKKSPKDAKEENKKNRLQMLDAVNHRKDARHKAPS